MERGVHCYICLQEISGYERSDCECKGTLGHRHLACASQMPTKQCCVCKTEDLNHPEYLPSSPAKKESRAEFLLRYSITCCFLVLLKVGVWKLLEYFQLGDEKGVRVEILSSLIFAYTHTYVGPINHFVLFALLGVMLGVAEPKSRLAYAIIFVVSYLTVKMLLYVYDVGCFYYPKLKRKYKF